MKNSETAIEQLYPKLQDYVESQGFNFNGSDFTNCITPEHEDRHPSMHLIKNADENGSQMLHCFSCQVSANIFHAAQYLEGLPLAGRDFFNITLPCLCERFGIEYKADELTEDEREAYTRKRAYRDATQIISCGDDEDLIPNHVKDKLKNRNYTTNQARIHSIGGVEHFDSYKETLINLGWEENYLNQIGLLRSDLFNANNLLFSIKNEFGEPVAFVGRRVPWNKTMTMPKFTNSNNSDIYQKGHILYNFHNSKKIKKGPLYIVEGYPDTITLHNKGLKKVAGIGGIAFTDDHTELLNRNEIVDIIVCLDGDVEGIKATQDLLKKLSNYRCFNTKVIDIPINQDPDDFINEKGIKEFKLLPTITPFEWILKHSDKIGEELVESTLPVILEEKNFVKQSSMIKALARTSGVEQYIVRKEIERRQSWHENEFQNKISDLRDRLIFRAQKEKTNFKTLIYETLRDHERIEKSHKNLVEEDGEYIERYSEMKDKYLTNPEITGLKLNSFPFLQNCFDGFPKEQCLISLAGKPNIGKTSFLRHLLFDLVNSNDNVFVIFMTIDDNFEQTITPFIALDQDLSINEVRKPRLLDETRIEKFEQGYQNILQLQKDKMAIRDVTSGNDLDTLERHINKYSSKFPEKDMILFLDNFHKLGGMKSGDRRHDMVLKSERIKEISNIYNLPILQTVELRKMNHPNRPTLDDISETVQIEYDSNVIMLCHNDVHSNPLSHLKWDYQLLNNEVKEMPYLEVDIAKNKYSDFKGKFAYEFTTHKSHFREIDSKTFRSIMSESKEVTTVKESYAEYQKYKR